MNNYKILFGLRILKNIINNFLDSFLVLYFLDISDSNILSLGIYKLVSILTIYIVIFFTKNLTKTKNRTNLLRTGIILDFVYFLTIILLKDKVINYIYLVGLLYGLSAGFYYSVYNILESDGVTNEERAKFTGRYTSVEAILSIAFPIIFGSLISAKGFLKSLIVVLILVVLRIFLSFKFKDKNIPKSNKVNLKHFNQLLKKDKKFKQIFKVEFLNGVVFSEAAFSYIITIFIVKVFSNSFKLGIFTSIFNIITFFVGIIFAKFLKKKQYATSIKITMIFTIISLFIMIWNCNAITIVLFNLFLTISRTLNSLIIGNSLHDLSNDKKIKKEYKSEYWLTTETFVALGRTLSAISFILFSYFNVTIMIITYAIFLIIFTINIVKAQKTLHNKKIKDKVY